MPIKVAIENPASTSFFVAIIMAIMVNVFPCECFNSGIVLEPKIVPDPSEITHQSKFGEAKKCQTIASAQRAPRPSGGILSCGVFVATELSSDKAYLN